MEISDLVCDYACSHFMWGSNTGYPVAHAYLTPEEGREEMRGDVIIHEISSGANRLAYDMTRHLRL